MKNRLKEKSLNRIKKVMFLVLTLGLVFSLSACIKKNEDLSLKNGSTDELESFSGSIKDLIAKGKDLKCTYSINDVTGQGQMTGTTYISGDKSFSESELKGPDQNMKTNVLVDGEYMYTWSSMTPQGTKMNIKKMEELNNDDEEDSDDYEEYSKAYEEDYDYKCSFWKKDDSKFQAPSDIEFMDLTNMMTGMNESTEDVADVDIASSPESMCAMCDMMPNEAQRDECLANLNCG